MQILPWLKNHTKELLLTGTTLIATAITYRDVVTEEEAKLVVGDHETPLERTTRAVIGYALITLGNSFKVSSFFSTKFGDEVGDTLIKYGRMMRTHVLE